MARKSVHIRTAGYAVAKGDPVAVVIESSYTVLQGGTTSYERWEIALVDKLDPKDERRPVVTVRFPGGVKNMGIRGPAPAKTMFIPPMYHERARQLFFDHASYESGDELRRAIRQD